MGRVLIVLLIPKTTGVARPRFVSPSSKSMRVGAYDKTHEHLLFRQVVELSAGSSGCSSGTKGVTCRLTFSVPAGADTFDATLYDKPRASGNALSMIEKFPQTVIAGKTATLSMTLGGIAKSIDILATPSAGLTGDENTGFTITGSAPQTFTIVAKDADGNDIVGPGAPAVTMPAAPHAVGVTSPAPSKYTWTLTSQYSSTAGPTVAGLATIAVQATPVPNSGGTVVRTSVPLKLYQPWIYVVNSQASGNNAVTAYDENGNQKSVSGAWSGLQLGGWAVYSPSNQRLYIDEYQNSGIYGYDLMGNRKTANGAFAGIVYAGQLALDPVENQIYVPDFKATAANWVRVYDLAGNAVTIPDTAFAQLQNGAFAMARAPLTGDLYGANYNSSSITPFDTSGNTLPSAGFSGLSDPFAMTVDSVDGNVYVTNVGRISVFDAHGNPVTTAGGFPIPTYSEALAYDPYNDRIYATLEQPPGGVMEFDRQGHAQTLNKAAFPNLSYPYGIVVVP